MPLLFQTFNKGLLSGLLLTFFAFALSAQEDKDLAPVSSTYAITNVNIIQSPGRRIDLGTVIVKNGLIVSVGKGVAIPPEAIIIRADSMFVYAGFIDGLTRYGVNKPKDDNKDKVKDPGNPPPDRAGITPQQEVRSFLNSSDKSLEELRNIGFTVAQVVPHGNLLPGHAALVLTAGSSTDAMLLINKTALYSELTGAGSVYPNTVLGVMAKWRELYKQAAQAKSYESLYASNRVGLERPVADKTLEAFYPVIDQKTPVLFRSEKLLDIHRVFSLKTDLGFPLIIADVKEGWPIINKIKSSGAKVFLSLDLPEEIKKEKEKKEETSSAKTAAQVEKESLEKRKAEAIANYTSQAANFQKAGIQFGFSSMSAKPKDIPSNLRRMIATGLSEDAALAALTTAPAQLLGLSDRLGTIDNGKMANLVISDKSYFNEKAKVRYVFVDGVLYSIDAKEAKKSDSNAKVEIEGNWSTVAQTPQGNTEGKLNFKKSGNSYSGTISGGNLPAPVDAREISLEGNVLSYKYTLNFGGQPLNIEVEAKVEGDGFKGTVTAGQLGSFPIEGTRDPKK
jgi:Amidohydrolase family